MKSLCKIATLTLPAMLSACQPSVNAAEAPTALAAPAMDDAKAAGPLQTAVFAGGCFWGTQGVFEHVKGVDKAFAGYDGGDREHAHYDMVSNGDTGHAESVQVRYDPAQISYGQLLQIFMSVAHDPTQMNRQGPDEGTQYRSAIFYGNERQKQIATAYIAQLNTSHAFTRPIVTQLSPDKGFFQAEQYHQDYLVENPYALYIVYNDLPKVEHLKHLFPALYRDKPVTVFNR